MKNRDGGLQAHRTPVWTMTEWDAVAKPAKGGRDWQAEASRMAVMYAVALAARRRPRRR